MDNASKALVMAGAILIAVMLISLGVYLFNAASNTNEGMIQQIDTMALAAYNKNYEQYNGYNWKASDVKALIGRLRAHNNNIEERTAYGTITSTLNDGGIAARQNPTVNAGTAVNGTTTNPATVNTGSIRESSYYAIQVTGYNQLGAVSQITVWRQTNYFQN